MTDPATRGSAGYLAHADLPRIWADYPADLHPAFHALMCRFELCYPVGRSAGSGKHCSHSALTASRAELSLM